MGGLVRRIRFVVRVAGLEFGGFVGLGRRRCPRQDGGSIVAANEFESGYPAVAGQHVDFVEAVVTNAAFRRWDERIEQSIRFDDDEPVQPNADCATTFCHHSSRWVNPAFLYRFKAFRRVRCPTS
jgi:hypothetical protein